MLRLYGKYAKMLFVSMLQYRASFTMLTVGQFIVPFTALMGVAILFDRFDTLVGWRLYEVLLCFAVIHLGMNLAECFFRGFDAFAGMIVRGEFDRLLVRPQSTMLQVLGSQIEFARIGRLLNGTLVLAYAIYHLPEVWSISKLLIIVFMTLGSMVIFAGIFIVGASVCFWTTQGLEFINTFTDGGREMAQYPLDIYAKPIIRFFTFIIPYGLVNYYPLRYVLGHIEGPWLLYTFMPFVSILFLFPCIAIWRLGVRHYTSTGS